MTHQDAAPPEPWEVRLARNPSYLASLQATVGRVLFYSPSAWWWLVSTHLKAVLVGVVAVPLLTLLWLVMTVGLTLAGLGGCVTRPEEERQR
jgi:hypothetical protein